MRNLLLLGLMFSVFFSLQVISQTTVTLELRPGSAKGFDAEVRTDRDYPIWYEDDFITNCWTVQGQPFVQRSLLKFDLSSVPKSVIIKSAKLSLFCNTSSGHQQLHSGFNSSYLLRITSDWELKEVVWDNQPSTTMSGAVLLSDSYSQVQDYKDIDITNQVEYWYKNPEQNFGFLFRLADEQIYNAMVFASSDHLDPEKRPLLTIEYIICNEPDPNFSYAIGSDGKTVEFTVTSDSTASYYWDFGNGFYSDLPNPIFTFQETGDYNVCLTAMNECDTLTFCDVVRICDSPDSYFEYSGDGLSVTFKPADSSEATAYLWDFGDGCFSFLKEPVHSYNEAGSYRVCLIVSNDCDSTSFCLEVILDTNRVIKHFPEQVEVFPTLESGRGSIRGNGYSYGEDGNTIHFTVQSDSTANYFWDFGNGFYSDLSNPVFTFQETGDFNVCLIMIKEGDTLNYCDIIQICESPDPYFEFSTDGVSATFHPADSSEAAVYFWDFGDGFFSYLKDPVHIYNEEGSYQACLTISNECDSSTFCREIVLNTYGIIKNSPEQLEVFPNPTSGRVCLRNTETNFRFNSLKLFGARGDLVYELSNINELSNPEGLYLDFSFLGAGIYNLVIIGDKEVFNRKIILTNTN